MRPSPEISQRCVNPDANYRLPQEDLSLGSLLEKTSMNSLEPSLLPGRGRERVGIRRFIVGKPVDEAQTHDLLRLLNKRSGKFAYITIGGEMW
jgi:hypothetical protein